MKKNLIPGFTFGLMLALSAFAQPAGASGSSSSNPSKNRSNLPMPNTIRPTLVTYDAKSPDTKYPPIEQLRPPQGAPNVLIVLIDDAGFGSSSAFGGPCQTPNLEKLAAGGLKYNRFHTTALCSPTRQALLTGRNHHSAGMGNITEIASGDVDSVRLWGRLSAGIHAEAQPEIVALGDPIETMMRFKVLRSSSFDFDAIQIPVLDPDHARIDIRYQMGARAEEAACNQTMGFCEGLLALADVSVLHVAFEQRTWAGDDRTMLVIRWRAPRSPQPDRAIPPYNSVVSVPDEPFG